MKFALLFVATFFTTTSAFAFNGSSDLEMIQGKIEAAEQSGASQETFGDNADGPSVDEAEGKWAAAEAADSRFNRTPANGDSRTPRDDGPSDDDRSQCESSGGCYVAE